MIALLELRGGHLNLSRRLGAFASSLSPSLKGQMARQSAGALAARLIGLGCGFLYAVGIARLLGPSGYGVLALALSLSNIVAMMALLGINGLAVREVAAIEARQAWGELRSFCGWSARAVGVTSVCAALLMAGAASIPGPYSRALLLGALAVPLTAGLNLIRGIAQGHGAVTVAQLPMEVFRWVVTLPILAALILTGMSVGVTTVMLVTLAGLATALVAAIAYTSQVLDKGDGLSAEPRPRYWLVQSFPFLAIAMFGILGTEISTLLLGLLAGPYETGLYQPIAKLTPIMLLATTSIEAALAPKIVHRWEANDREGLQRVVGRSAVASTVATTAIAMLIVLASPFLLRAFGPQFTRYQALLSWIAAAQVINAATGSAPLLLAMTGDIKKRTLAQASTLVVQATLGIVLVPRLGAVGAVVSLVAAIVLWSVLHWWLALRATGIDTSVFGVLSRRRSAA